MMTVGFSIVPGYYLGQWRTGEAPV